MESWLDLFRSWGVEVEAAEAQPAGAAVQVWRCLRDGRAWINRFYEPVFAELAGRELAKGGWDVIQAEGIMSAQHLPRTPLPCGSLLMARDCLSLDHWRRWKHERSPRQLLQSQKIRWMESALYARFDRVAAIAPVDAEAMRRIQPGVKIELIPNGVDTQAMRPEPELEQEGTVLFSGAMDHGPNVDASLWMGREIWPLVRRECPEARLILVGRDPVAEVRALAEDPSITVPGTVADMRPWLARASVVTAPMRLGTGLKNKILEGAAMGRAMVATPLALEGLDFADGRELWAAESAAEFAGKWQPCSRTARARRTWNGGSGDG